MQNEDVTTQSASNDENTLELSFEYLMSKNSLKWITICSKQAMLMSVCLQSMVDELINQKSGADINNIQVIYINDIGLKYVSNYTPLSLIYPIIRHFCILDEMALIIKYVNQVPMIL